LKIEAAVGGDKGVFRMRVFERYLTVDQNEGALEVDIPFGSDFDCRARLVGSNLDAYGAEGLPASIDDCMFALVDQCDSGDSRSRLGLAEVHANFSADDSYPCVTAAGAATTFDACQAESSVYGAILNARTLSAAEADGDGAGVAFANGDVEVEEHLIEADVGLRLVWLVEIAGPEVNGVSGALGVIVAGGVGSEDYCRAGSVRVAFTHENTGEAYSGRDLAVLAAVEALDA